jgi:hypothetical protein
LGVEGEFAFLELDGSIFSHQLPQAIECGLEGAMCQVARSIRPKGVAELLLVDISASEGDEGLEQMKRLLLHFPSKPHNLRVPFYLESPERINPERPGPVWQVKAGAYRNQLALADEVPHIIGFNAGF